MACIENKEERGRENFGFCGRRKNKKVKRMPIGHYNEKFGKKFISSPSKRIDECQFFVVGSFDLTTMFQERILTSFVLKLDHGLFQN